MAEFKFNKLTPSNDVKIDSSHEAAMKYVLEDKDIRNVAISGNYGSGKSSFIETYKSINKNFKPLHISLAHFSSHEDSENNGSETQVKIIEGKIINQLLHQIDSNHIPMTIFKSKKNPSIGEVRKLSAVILIFLLSVLLLWNYHQLAILVRELFPAIPHYGNIVRCLAYVLLIGDIVYAVYKLSALQLKRRLIKNISFRSSNISGDIEVFQSEDGSYFDKYLDDVLYLFDNCQSDAIIFEDIDRFETNLIFEKLREINTLINNKKADGEKLLFLYLIKDDMFISQDRTKFFDFLIPIIPVITASNSGEKLGEILANLGEGNSVNKTLLKQVAIYIDDMRLVHNICNEFVFYKNNLFSQKANENNKLNLSVDKIFAIIVYKNIFPRDFSLLQKGSGFVNKLFASIDELRQENLDEKTVAIEEIEDEILSAERESSKNKLELYSSFLKVPEDRVAIQVNDKLENEFTSRLEFIEEILSEGAIIESVIPSYSGQLEGQEEELADIFPMNDSEFQKRLNALENREHLSNLYSSLDKLRKEYETSKVEKLSTLINRTFFDKTLETEPYLKDDSKNSLIMYFLRNSYIDESYPDYITYFYPNSLKRQDKEFLNAVQGEIELDWNYQLIEVEEVNERLNDFDFERKYTLNFDLFEYLLQTDSKKRLRSYFSDDNVKFVNQFLQQNSRHLAAKITVLLNLVDLNQGMLTLFLSSDEISEQDKMYVTVLLLSFIDLSEFNWKEEPQEAIINFVNSNWISIQETFDNWSELINHGQIQDNLKFLEAKIQEFNFEDTHKTMSEFVYENNFYEINVANLSNIVSYLDSSMTQEDLKRQPITTVKKFDKLFDYVARNINDFTTQMIPFMSNHVCDKYPDMYYLLNQNEVTVENRIAYLKKIQSDILELEELTEIQIKDAAIEFNKAKYSTDNILHYFNEYNSWNEKLISFVNAQEKPVFLTEIFNSLPEEEQGVFFEETVKCMELSDEQYKTILSAIKWHYIEFNFEDISDEKMTILINTRIISDKFSLKTLNFLRDNYPNHVIDYLKAYIEGYLSENEDDDDVYEEIEMLELLQEPLTDPQKIGIIDKISGNITISKESYSESVTDYILQNKFDVTDLEYILTNYNEFVASTKRLVEKLFVEHFDDVLEEEYSVKKELLQAVIVNADIDIEQRRLILANYLDVFTFEESLNLFRNVELTEILLAITDGKRPKVDITGYNKLILDYLKRKKIITYKEEGDCYRIRGRSRKARES